MIGIAQMDDALPGVITQDVEAVKAGDYLGEDLLDVAQVSVLDRIGEGFP
jgi:hypothetical protein